MDTTSNISSLEPMEGSSKPIENSSAMDRLTGLLLGILDVIHADQLLKVFTESLSHALGKKNLNSIGNINLENLDTDLFLSENQLLMNKNEELEFQSNLEKRLEQLFLEIYPENTIVESGQNSQVDVQNQSHDVNHEPVSKTNSNNSENITISQHVLPENSETPVNIPISDLETHSDISESNSIHDPSSINNIIDSNTTDINSYLENEKHIYTANNLDHSHTSGSVEDLVAQFPGLISENIYEMAIALQQITRLKYPLNYDTNNHNQDVNYSENSTLRLAPVQSTEVMNSNVSKTGKLNEKDVDELNYNQKQSYQESRGVRLQPSGIETNSEDYQLKQVLTLGRSQKRKIQSVNERWLSTNTLKRLRHLYGVNYLKGRFTKQENEKISQVVSQVCNEKGWTKEILLQFLFQKNPNDQDLYSGVWRQICSAIPNRPVQAMYHHIKRALNPKNYQGNWTEEQDEQLLFWVERLGSRWEIIGRRMNRTGTNCRDRWRNIKPGEARQKGRWTDQEKNNLFNCVLQARAQSGIVNTSEFTFGDEIEMHRNVEANG
ncbi:hypothetical protein BB559_004278 [Furculomyces boomerangus]|uniref:Uncharacterized protein n=2 Tax=Harpellales TaxID=61421 RepID=A0A2T9YFL7_9FUNG|nr:hypothetical protein BB559_004278 [Furculomyces boomerangus]PWA01463.1 hypothetical protein BB558_002437 [Smittium angustum]